MAAGSTVNLLAKLGLGSPNRCLVMLVLVWLLNVLWLGLNYFWRFASVQVLLAVPILLLVYGLVALLAYVYWGVKRVREEDAPYANVMVGVIVAITLLYFSFTLLRFVLEAVG
ncbi:hypothetical protein [Botryobacter ruber]|uniref:hypothetical protein n=1 Tax=Botryobacter ruber TaxID=2171629 RepID=UPI000E0A4892|nr:hypothetical protein [Botryobacter ruber]